MFRCFRSLLEHRGLVGARGFFGVEAVLLRGDSLLVLHGDGSNATTKGLS